MPQLTKLAGPGNPDKKLDARRRFTGYCGPFSVAIHQQISPHFP
jgi:hypothetical protein